MENASSSKLQLASFQRPENVSFSVVINTDNRIDFLKRTLSGLGYQQYSNFEVCVVCGPTPDRTREYVGTLAGDLKISYCEERNLSKSRNIGIAMSSADVVVFIDDDSVPEAEWLADLSESYSDERVGAVGGFVYDHTGLKFQAEYVTVNRLGYPAHWSEPAPHLNFPFSQNIPHLLGTNCSFRRSALLEIGGFDEEYEYFLDETDVCCRINDAGYLIVQRRDGFVHHKYAPSHLRDENRIVKNWYPLIKNRVYYGMRHALNHHSVRDVMAAGAGDATGWEGAVVNAAPGIYTAADVERFYAEANAAVRDGYSRGLEPPKLLRETTITAHKSAFLPFALNAKAENRRVICFVTQDYPPGQNGGIARYFSQFARALAAAGHHVHVLTKARGPASLDYEDGVWVHRVDVRVFATPDISPVSPMLIPNHIWSYCQTMLEEVAAIHKRRKVDLVYCPLWDCEPLGFLLDGRFPVMVALQTTMKFWLDSQPLRLVDKEWMRVFGDPIVAMEEYILSEAHMMHAISHAIVRDIRKRYSALVDEGKILYSHLCMDDWSKGVVSKPTSDKVHVLFVGRLESRKGIDVLLEAIPVVLAKFPDAILDIVGDDTILRPDGLTYKEEFSELEILPPDLKDRIVFHGRVGEDELVNFYANSDIFVAPSRYESFGLIFLEALVFGKPVIGCDAGGGPEVITDGKTGLLVKPGDVDGLRVALETLLSDPDLRQKMGLAGRKDYEERFTTANMVNDLTAFLKSRDNMRKVTGEKAVVTAP